MKLCFRGAQRGVPEVLKLLCHSGESVSLWGSGRDHSSKCLPPDWSSVLAGDSNPGDTMKRSIRTVGALGVAGALLMGGVGATAASAAEAGFAVEAYASDGSNQINAAGQFLFDSRKSDEPGSTYEMAYRGTLDMTGIWEEYLSLRGIGMGLVGGESGWQAANFLGTWNVGFTVDPSVVTVDQSLLNCEAVQAEFVAQNVGTSASDTLQCANVAYDPASGRISLQISLLKPDGSPVKGADLDRAAAEPPAVYIATPPGALTVKQSTFEVAKTFAVTNTSISGQMRMDHWLAGAVPVSFDVAGNDLALYMVPTFDSEFSFASLSEGVELPEAVLALLPAGQYMLRDGTAVEPPAPAQASVPVDDDTQWVFRGWDQASATVTGANVSFVGGWELTTEDDSGGDDGDEDDEFGVSYRFHAADAVGDGPLPDAVIALLPATDEKFAPGTTVVPTQPSETSVIETSDDPETGVRTITTWDFQGWDAESIEISDSDVTFTGTWSKTVTEELIIIEGTYGVTYQFRAADGVDGPLPDSVRELLPVSTERFVSGDTVTPIALSKTEVIETADDAEQNTRTVTTWTFGGWEPEVIEVADSDVTFTGAWAKDVTTSPITPGPTPNPDPTPDPDPTPKPEGDKKSPLSDTGGAGPGLLVAGAALLLLAGGAVVLRNARRQARNADQAA